MKNINIELHLPFPPSINDYYVKTRNGIFVSKKGKIFRKQINENIYEQIGSELNIDSGLMFVCILYPPDNRKRDVDNYNKPLFDAITNSNFWLDDSQVHQLFIFRGEIIKQGKIVSFIKNAGFIIPANNPHIVLSLIK